MRLKLIAGIAAALVLVLMAAAYAIVSSYDFNKFKPLITGAVRDATGRELTIGGDIGLKFGLSPALVAGDVGFENAPWGSRPEMARIKRLEAEVSLIPLIFGNVVVKRLVLAGPDILVERDRSGRSNLEFGTKKKARPPAPSAEEANIPSFKKIRIENGLLAYRDGQSGRLYEVKISSFDARTEAMGGRIEAGLKGAYNGMSFDASWRISNPSPGAYDISDLRASFGESDLSGTLGVIFGGKQPGLRAELSSKKLDLRPLLGKTDKKGGEEAGVKKEKVFSGSPLPFDALKKAEADLRLSAGKILLPRMALNGLEARMTVKDGRLTFKPLKASIGGGAFEGRLHLDTRGKTPELSAVFRAEGIDMGKMLKELGVEEAFEGKINVDIDVKGSGGTTAALMAGLNGNLSVVMGKGRMDNKYLGLLGADLGPGLERLIN
ncbi:MAG: AsmA family protein, partial [Deltaproteobacteria bacterium]|nr:AsmA family protein [Deltaproteobacteria bacterium]